MAVEQAGLDRWLSLREGAKGETGFLTTNARKEAMCLQLREALRQDCLSLASDFFSTSLGQKEAIKQLSDELRRFSVVSEPGKTVFSAPRKTYSGKSGGSQDDVAIAVQLALTSSKMFNSDPKYERFAWRYRQFAD